MTRPSTEWSDSLRGLLKRSAQAIAKADTPEKERNVVANTIVSLGHHLKAICDDGCELPVFDRLITALRRVDEGHGDPMLKTKRSRGRPGSTTEEAFIRSQAIMFVHMLVADGVKVEVAEKEVAAAFEAAGVKGRRNGGLSARTIHDWRDRGSGDRAEDGKWAERFGEGFALPRSETRKLLRQLKMKKLPYFQKLIKAAFSGDNVES